MSKTRSFALFGDDVAGAEARSHEDGDTAPEYALSEKSRRLKELPTWLREMVPWFAGAVEHSERYGSLAQQARVYRLACVMLAAAVLLEGGVIGWLATEVADTRVVPYIVQVDKHGFAVPVGPLERTKSLEARVVMQALSQWITAHRTVTGHWFSQKDKYAGAFAFVGKGSVAATKMNEFYNGHDDAYWTSRHVEVEVTRVAPMKSESEFTVEWVETLTDLAGEHPQKSLFTSVVQVRISPSQTFDDIQANPLGVFVDDFTISKLK